MSDIVIEQAIYGGQDSGSYRLLARSPGFLDEWDGEANHLCASFGKRPAGVSCPRCVFAQPFDRKHVAIVQVADQGRGEGRPAALAFHVMILDQEGYRALGADPFLVAERFPPGWLARGELPVLGLSTDTVPRRTVAELQKVLKRPGESPTLLGAAQALVDGGRVVFERQAPDTELVSGLWLLLPTTTRFHLWPASFAFSNVLAFDALVAPQAKGQDYKDHLTEQQAGDYPQGHYELNLQMAVEAGDQQELDILLARRSRRETWRMGLLLLVLVLILVTVGKWLTFTPPAASEKKSKPAVEQRDPAPAADPNRESKLRD